MPASETARDDAARGTDIVTTELRYRVRGPLHEEVVANAESDTVFVRTSFDQSSRAFLAVSEDGYVIRFEGFKKAFWEWRDERSVRRTFGPGEAAAACRYFNSLALSPGYRGPVNRELEEHLVSNP